jgi:hypothetical protein
MEAMLQTFLRPSYHRRPLANKVPHLTAPDFVLWGPTEGKSLHEQVSQHLWPKNENIHQEIVAIPVNIL